MAEGGNVLGEAVVVVKFDTTQSAQALVMQAQRAGQQAGQAVNQAMGQAMQSSPAAVGMAVRPWGTVAPGLPAPFGGSTSSAVSAAAMAWGSSAQSRPTPPSAAAQATAMWTSATIAQQAAGGVNATGANTAVSAWTAGLPKTTAANSAATVAMSAWASASLSKPAVPNAAITAWTAGLPAVAANSAASTAMAAWASASQAKPAVPSAAATAISAWTSGLPAAPTTSLAPAAALWGSVGMRDPNAASASISPFAAWADRARRFGGLLASDVGGMGGSFNPFSARGLARLTGSGVAAFGVLEAMRVSTGFMEAESVGEHPDRILRGWEGEAQGRHAALDPFLQKSASELTEVNYKQKVAEAQEQIPLAGTVFQFIHALTDSTGKLKDQAAAIELSSKAHSKLYNQLQEAPAQIASALGDSVGAARQQAELKIREAGKLHSQAVSLRPDPLADRAYIAQKILGGMEVDIAKGQDAATITRLQRTGTVTAADITAMHLGTPEANLNAAQARRDVDYEKLRSDHNAKITAGEEAYKKLTDTSKEQKAFDDAGKKRDQILRDWTGTKEENDAYYSASAAVRAREAELRKAQRDRPNTPEAQQTKESIEYAKKLRDADLTAFKAETKRIMEAAGIGETHAAGIRAANLNSIRVGAQGGLLRAMDRPLEAQLGEIGAAGKNKAAELPLQDVYNDQRREIGAATQNQMLAARISYAREREVTAYEQQTRVGAANLDQKYLHNAASTYSQTRGLLGRLSNANPNDFAGEQEAVIAELKAMRAQITPQGGGVAASGWDAMFSNDPFAIGNRAKDLKAQRAAINNAQAAAILMKGPMFGMIAQAKGLGQQIAGWFGLGGGGAIPAGGAASDVDPWQSHAGSTLDKSFKIGDSWYGDHSGEPGSTYEVQSGKYAGPGTFGQAAYDAFSPAGVDAKGAAMWGIAGGPGSWREPEAGSSLASMVLPGGQGSWRDSSESSDSGGMGGGDKNGKDIVDLLKRILDKIDPTARAS